MERSNVKQSKTPFNENVLRILFSICLGTSVFLASGMRFLQRYPNWDDFWVDSMTSASMFKISEALKLGLIPYIDLKSGFGINIAGTPQSLHNFISPFNLLLVLGVPDYIVVSFRTIVFFVLLIWGISLFCKELNFNDKITHYISPLIITIPYFWSSIIFSPFGNALMLLPVVMFLMNKLLVNFNSKLFIAINVIFLVSIYEILSFITFFLVIIGYLLAVVVQKGIRNKETMLRSILILSGYLISSIHFWLPYLWQAYQKAADLKRQGEVSQTPIELGEYFEFLKRNGITTFLWPAEGSALLLYIFPIFILLAFCSFIYAKNLDQKIKLVRNALVVVLLVQITSLALAYGIQPIAKFMPSYLRSNLNIFPILIFILGLIGIESLISSQKKNILRVILFAGPVATIILDAWDPTSIWNSERYSSLISSPSNLFGVSEFANLIVRVTNDSSKLNLIVTVLISSYIYVTLRDSMGIRTVVKYILVVIVCLICVLLSIESRGYMNGWQQISKSSVRVDDYHDRWDKWSALVDIKDPNFRFMPVGKDIYGGSGRNWKTLADTELNGTLGQNFIYQYRETMSSIESGVYSRMSRNGKNTNFFPPTVSDLLENIELLNLFGVKYVVSADEEIDNVSFKLVGEYRLSRQEYEIQQSGKLYLYQYRKATPIAFTAPKVTVVPKVDILSKSLDSRPYPWINGLAISSDYNGRRDQMLGVTDSPEFSQLPTKISIRNPNQLEIQIPKENPNKFLVISYLNDANWEALVDGRKQKIFDAYGGFMMIPINSGKSEVILTYHDDLVFVTACISIFYFLFVILFFTMVSKTRIKLKRIRG